MCCLTEIIERKEKRRFIDMQEEICKKFREKVG